MKFSAPYDPRYTLTVHLVQITLVVLVLILSITRVAITTVPITRATIMGIPIVSCLPIPTPAPPPPPPVPLAPYSISQKMVGKANLATRLQPAEHKIPHHPSIPNPDGARGPLP